MARQVRAVRTRQALILAAAELFADDGYALASLPAICKRAGVSTGALHFHFPSKDALARQVEDSATAFMKSMVAQCRSDADRPLQSLVLATSGLLSAIIDDPVVRAGVKLCGDPSRKNGAEVLRLWHTLVCELVVQAQLGGELGDVPPEVAASVIVSATVGFVMLRAWDSDWLSPERLADFWDLLLPRLMAPPEH
ncbi:ScbR family autoregulator-binding transcription factor [Streptomyces sp. NPDC127197]|uniref:ScbR family autoregulator-binding transcription factor n=1 Tax=Streptomyces sp. NPDC127197 TaxID=3345388 RepID=UPI0036349AE7